MHQGGAVEEYMALMKSGGYCRKTDGLSYSRVFCEQNDRMISFYSIRNRLMAYIKTVWKLSEAQVVNG